MQSVGEAGPSHKAALTENISPKRHTGDIGRVVSDAADNATDVEMLDADSENPPTSSAPVVTHRNTEPLASPIPLCSPIPKAPTAKAKTKIDIRDAQRATSTPSDDDVYTERRPGKRPIQLASPAADAHPPLLGDQAKVNARVEIPPKPPSTDDDSDEEMPTADEIIALTQSKRKPLPAKSKSKPRPATPEPAPSSPLTSPEPASPDSTRKLARSRPANISPQVSVVIPSRKPSKVQHMTSAIVHPSPSNSGPSRPFRHHDSSPNTLTPRTAKNPYAKNDDSPLTRTNSDLSNLPAVPSSSPQPTPTVTLSRGSKRAAAIKGAESLAANVADMNQFQREMKASQGDVRKLSFGGAAKRPRETDDDTNEDHKVTHKTRNVSRGINANHDTKWKTRVRSNLRHETSDDELPSSDRDSNEEEKHPQPIKKSKAQLALEKGGVGKVG